MGPRSRERGKSIAFPRDGTLPELQWGRAHVSAESLPPERLPPFRRFASMGPRSRERGKEVKRRSKIGCLKCFNGAALT